MSLSTTVAQWTSLSDEIWMIVLGYLFRDTDTTSTMSLLRLRLVSRRWNEVVMEVFKGVWRRPGPAHKARELCFSPPRHMGIDNSAEEERLWFWPGVTTIMLECRGSELSSLGPGPDPHGTPTSSNEPAEEGQGEGGCWLKVGQYKLSTSLWEQWQTRVETLILSCDCRSTPVTRVSWVRTRWAARGAHGPRTAASSHLASVASTVNGGGGGGGGGSSDPGGEVPEEPEDGLALERAWVSFIKERHTRGGGGGGGPGGQWPCLLEAITAWSWTSGGGGAWRKLTACRLNLSVDLELADQMAGGPGATVTFPRVDKLLTVLTRDRSPGDGGGGSGLKVVEINQCLRGELGLGGTSGGGQGGHGGRAGVDPTDYGDVDWSPNVTRWVRAGSVTDAVHDAGFLEKITNNRRLMQQLSRLPQVHLNGLVLAHSSSLRPYRPLFEFEEEYLLGASQAWLSRQRRQGGQGGPGERSMVLRVRPPPPGHLHNCWLTDAYSLMCDDCHAMEHGGGHAGGLTTSAEQEAGMTIWLRERHYHWRQRCLQREARSQQTSFKLDTMRQFRGHLESWRTWGRRGT